MRGPYRCVRLPSIVWSRPAAMAGTWVKRSHLSRISGLFSEPWLARMMTSGLRARAASRL